MTMWGSSEVVLYELNCGICCHQLRQLFKMSIPECENTPKRFDSSSLTTKLSTVPGVDHQQRQITLDCAAGVQTVFHPPLTLRPIIQPPSNRFRQEVLRRYPHLVRKESLYDPEKEKILDPDDPMISTYGIDYGNFVKDIELVHTGVKRPRPHEETLRLPGKDYKPGLWLPISTEMKKFYALPGGKWALHASQKPPKPLEKPPRSGTTKIKWETEYQANINGMANYIKKIGALTRSNVIRVYKMPTLPVD